MASVVLRPNESQEQLLKRFRKQVAKSGILRRGVDRRTGMRLGRLYGYGWVSAVMHPGCLPANLYPMPGDATKVKSECARCAEPEAKARVSPCR